MTTATVTTMMPTTIDNDGGNGTNFDEQVCDVADMLDDVLGLGEDSDNESDDDEMLWGEA